jgi:aminopeptidase N
MEGARTFALSLSPYFGMQQAETESGVTVRSYYFTDDAAGGMKALQTAVRAVETFSELFSPYHHAELTIVQGDFVPSMEYDGLVFLGHELYHYTDDTARDYLVVMTVHEVSHQWWFALVGNDQAMEPWLDEAMATYSERIFYEQVHPEDVDWWQETRLESHDSLSGWVDTTIYDLNQDYSEAVYLRGAEFLGKLRERTGDRAFFEFLKAYTVQYSGQRVTADDHFRVLREHTRADISDIISIYFNQPH